MNEAEKILVVFLSTSLAIFLLLGIIIAVKVVGLIKKVQHIADKVESIADRAESVTEFIEKSATPLAIGKLIASFGGGIFSKAYKKRRKG